MNTNGRKYSGLTILSIVGLLFFSCSRPTKSNVDVFPVKIGNHWGYIKQNGIFVVDCIYDNAYAFSGGLACIEQDGHVGYISPRGKVIIDPQYVRATSFSEGKAFVVREGESLECINTSGSVLFTLDTLDWAYNYCGGFSRVKSSYGKYGFINEAGTLVIPAIYESAGDFSDGLAYVNTGKEAGYINKKGEMVFTTVCSEVYPFSEGLAKNKIDDSDYGYIDKKGRVAIPYQFSEASYFKEGLAWVKVNGIYGYINKRGKFVIAPQFNYVSVFSNGLAAVRKGRQIGYIDKNGKLIIDDIYKKAESFIGDYAFVMNSDKKYGLMNKKGRFVVFPQYSDIKSSSGSYGIRTDTFNGRAFLSSFTAKIDHGKVDGLSGTTTLGDIRRIYNNVSVSKVNTWCYKPKSKPVNDVRISEVAFIFSDKTYSDVSSYKPVWNSSYKADAVRHYHNAVPLDSIQYTLVSEDYSDIPPVSIAKALAKELIRVYGSTIESSESKLVLHSSESIPETSLTWSKDKVFIRFYF